MLGSFVRWLATWFPPAAAPRRGFSFECGDEGGGNTVESAQSFLGFLG